MSRHPGIEVRVSLPAGVVIQGDSDWLHFQAIFGGKAIGEWFPVLAELDAGGRQAGAVIELRAVELDDPAEAPDDLSALGDLGEGGRVE